jgi:hypothetical protein
MRYILHNFKLIDKITNKVSDINDENLEIISSTTHPLFEDKTFISYLKSDLSFNDNEHYADCEIQEINSQQAMDFMQGINDKFLLELNEDGTISANIETAISGLHIFNKDIQPFRDWTWNDVVGKWVQTSIKLNEVIFDSQWSEENKKWTSACKIHPNRLLRGFQLWGVEEKNNTSSFNKACSTTEYAIKSIQEITHGDKSIDQLVTSRENNEVTFPVITMHYTVIDLAPLAVITYSERDAESNIMPLYEMHPQHLSRTIHELFRLIIEWAYSYTQFQNTEPMAELCHNILQIVQMPKNVRDDLIGIRPQQVGRFIIGDANALQEYAEDAEPPQSFTEWISDIYYSFRTRTMNAPLNINQNNLPESYPM